MMKQDNTFTGDAAINETDYQTIENAAYITGLSKGRIYQLAADGMIKALPPRPMLVDINSLKAYAATAKRGRPSKE